MYDAIAEGGTYRTEVWPDPGAHDTVDAEGWVVNLRVHRRPDRKTHPAEFVRPVTVLILGNPPMTDVWASTRLTPDDEVTVDLLGAGRVVRRYPPLPSELRVRLDSLAHDPVSVWVEALTVQARVRLGRPAPDPTTLLGQPRHRITGTWSA
ncbi:MULTISPECIES: hypothetical protein [unclassified Cellulomonas]|uniref:hypothetical protein n=1 Tax=unclassified Cellulomonas TaxID=2620175 RepID=UPI001C4F7021|nr:MULTISPECIES: hypothetical protein [unclassified Cellulomonas]MBW0255833.1 hypothetical protein [Cellulomonas sp. PS-H5]MCG7288060.1 hypothetical protein [Cellulomonas sp. ACRRI]